MSSQSHQQKTLALCTDNITHMSIEESRYSHLKVPSETRRKNVHLIHRKTPG